MSSEKIVVFNLGCKVNQYECDVICEELTKNGYLISQELSYADYYVINTCAVTSEAERKSRQCIARCKNLNPNAKILICGCASQKSPEAFIKDGVVYVSGVASKEKIVNFFIENNFNSLLNVTDLPNAYEDLQLTVPHRTRTYVKIQDGCNNFCSYCIIPYLRGRSRSRNIDSVIEEVKRLSLNTQEIVLTGIDLMSFGKETNSYDLTDLIKRLSDVDVRIRLGSIYAENVTEEFLDACYNLKKFCSHFHLSMQSGDNDVLKSMNRHYTTDVYRNKINLIRKYDDNVNLTTDVIIGYPTEKDENFINTCNFVQEMNFSDLHIFPFSTRNGTKASKLPIINGEIIKERKKIITKIKDNLYTNYLLKNINKSAELLVEESDGLYFVGHTRNYIKVYTRQNKEIVEVIPNKIYKDGLLED